MFSSKDNNWPFQNKKVQCKLFYKIFNENTVALLKLLIAADEKMGLCPE